MTEQEWLQATDPTPMLEHLPDKTSERQLRLFTVACCRRVWHLLTDERSRRAVEVGERFADGCAGLEELKVWEDAQRAQLESEVREGGWPVGSEHPKTVAARLAVLSAQFYLTVDGPDWSLKDGLCDFVDVSSDPTAERLSLSGLARELFGNPFRPVSINPAWLTWNNGLLVSMAQKMYDSRDFSDMLVLADALEEAGCDDADILTHCRHPSVHVRGCWVVDSILGRC